MPSARQVLIRRLTEAGPDAVERTMKELAADGTLARCEEESRRAAKTMRWLWLAPALAACLAAWWAWLTDWWLMTLLESAVATIDVALAIWVFRSGSSLNATRATTGNASERFRLR